MYFNQSKDCIGLDGYAEHALEYDARKSHYHISPTDSITKDFCRIGDTTFSIDPESISVTRVNQKRSVKPLRSAGSIQSKTGQSDIIVEIDIYFDGVEEIFGTSGSGHEIDNYLKVDPNSLAALLAQFQRAPFLPVFNDLLNNTHGISALALTNLNLATVPQYPNLVRATLVCMKFDHSIYAPGLKELSHGFIWPVFRWYWRKAYEFTRSIIYKSKEMSGLFEFYVADEDDLQQFKEAIRGIISQALDGSRSSIYDDEWTGWDWMSRASDKAKREKAAENLGKLYGRPINMVKRELPPADELILTSVSVNLENTISMLRMSNKEVPAQQFLGSIDKRATLTFLATNREAARFMSSLAGEIEEIVRNNRLAISSGYFNIKNEMLDLCGIESVIIDGVQVKSVPDYPGIFEVTMQVTAFNRLQQAYETLKSQRVSEATGEAPKSSTNKTQEMMVRASFNDDDDVKVRESLIKKLKERGPTKWFKDFWDITEGTPEEKKRKKNYIQRALRMGKVSQEVGRFFQAGYIQMAEEFNMQLELYMDLGLPTTDELLKAIKGEHIFGKDNTSSKKYEGLYEDLNKAWWLKGRFPDPDFYMDYPIEDFSDFFDKDGSGKLVGSITPSKEFIAAFGVADINTKNFSSEIGVTAKDFKKLRIIKSSEVACAIRGALAAELHAQEVEYLEGIVDNMRSLFGDITKENLYLIVAEQSKNGAIKTVFSEKEFNDLIEKANSKYGGGSEGNAVTDFIDSFVNPNHINKDVKVTDSPDAIRGLLKSYQAGEMRDFDTVSEMYKERLGFNIFPDYEEIDQCAKYVQTEMLRDNSYLLNNVIAYMGKARQKGLKSSHSDLSDLKSLAMVLHYYLPEKKKASDEKTDSIAGVLADLSKYNETTSFGTNIGNMQFPEYGTVIKKAIENGNFPFAEIDANCDADTIMATWYQIRNGVEAYYAEKYLNGINETKEALKKRREIKRNDTKMVSCLPWQTLVRYLDNESGATEIEKAFLLSIAASMGGVLDINGYYYAAYYEKRGDDTDINNPVGVYGIFRITSDDIIAYAKTEDGRRWLIARGIDDAFIENMPKISPGGSEGYHISKDDHKILKNVFCGRKSKAKADNAATLQAMVALHKYRETFKEDDEVVVNQYTSDPDILNRYGKFDGKTAKFIGDNELKKIYVKAKRTDEERAPAINRIYTDHAIPDLFESDSNSDHMLATYMSYYDMYHYNKNGRLLQAYPSYLLQLVDEGPKVGWMRMFPCFYALSSVSEIEVIADRENIGDVCILTLSNAYGAISSYTADQALANMTYDMPWFSWWKLLLPPDSIGILPGRTKELREIAEMRDKQVSRIMLRPGARLHLRMGFGANAASLPVVFNGTITEVDRGMISTVIAQGDGVEFDKLLSFTDQAHANLGGLFYGHEPRDVIMTLMNARIKEQLIGTGFWGNIKKWAADKLYVGSNGKLLSNSAFEITHFGNPVIWKSFGWPEHKAEDEGDDLNLGVNEIRSYLRSNTLQGGEQYLSRIIHYSFSLSSGNLFGLLIGNGTLPSPYAYTFGETGENVYMGSSHNYTGQKHQKRPYLDGDAKPNSHIAHGGFLNAVINRTYGMNMYVYNKKAWDIVQLCALGFPPYLASIRPFEYRNTLFYGSPFFSFRHGYIRTPSTAIDNGGHVPPEVLGIPIAYEAKTFAQLHYISSESNLVHNGIRASSDSIYTDVDMTWYAWDAKNDEKQALIQHQTVDRFIYPEFRKTVVVDSGFLGAGTPGLSLFLNLPLLGPLLTDMSRVAFHLPQWWQKTYSEYTGLFGAFCAGERARMIARSMLRDYVKHMYQGELITLPMPSLRPHDMLWLSDMPIHMYGPLSVRRVVQHFSHSTGLCTSIEPDLVAEVKGDMHWLNWFMGMAAHSMMGLSILAFDRAKNAAVANLVAGIKALPLTAGQVSKTAYWHVMYFLQEHGKMSSQTAGNVDKALAKMGKFGSKISGGVRAAAVSVANWTKSLVAYKWIERKFITGGVNGAVRGAEGLFARTVGRVAATRVGSVMMAALGLAPFTGGTSVIAWIAYAAVTELLCKAFGTWVMRNIDDTDSLVLCPLRYMGGEFTAGISGHKSRIIAPIFKPNDKEAKSGNEKVQDNALYYVMRSPWGKMLIDEPDIKDKMGLKLADGVSGGAIDDDVQGRVDPNTPRRMPFTPRTDWIPANNDDKSSVIDRADSAPDLSSSSLVKFINKYLKDINCPAYNESPSGGELMVRYGAKYNVNPLIMLAIVMHNSKGKKPKDGDSNWMLNIPQGTGKTTENKISTFAQEIQDMTKDAKNNGATPSDVFHAGEQMGAMQIYLTTESDQWHKDALSIYNKISALSPDKRPWWRIYKDFGLSSGGARTASPASDTESGSRSDSDSSSFKRKKKFDKEFTMRQRAYDAFLYEYGLAYGHIGRDTLTGPEEDIEVSIEEIFNIKSWQGETAQGEADQDAEQIDGSVVAFNGNLVLPLDKYRVESEFGPRWGRQHEGIDLGASTGTPIKAAADGKIVKIVKSRSTEGYGNRVDIRHVDGYTSRYAHLDSFSKIKVGMDVGAGTIIGTVGSTGFSTGSHLHFEWRTPSGQAVNPRKVMKF